MGAGKQQKKPKRGNFKVCVCGGSGGIGQPLSMLMAMDPKTFTATMPAVVSCLAGVLAGGAAGFAAGKQQKKPKRGNFKVCDDLFKINAGIAKEVVEACAKYCPDAIVALIVNP